MILTIDIGNTCTNIGIFKKNKIIKEWQVPTHKILKYQKIKKEISKYHNIRSVIVSSVVPWADKIVRKWFKKAIFVNHKNIGIKIKVKNPSEVGADRLVNALAAYKLFGGSTIVVDFGTATTFDVISAKGEYLGGAIAPGILLARDILYEKTAKLPKISIKAPRNIIGKTTLEAMRSGLVFGYVAMIEGMVQRFKSKIQNSKFKIKVIATGGLAKLICKFTKVIDKIDQKLTLKGLKIIGERIDG